VQDNIFRVLLIRFYQYLKILVK